MTADALQARLQQNLYSGSLLLERTDEGNQFTGTLSTGYLTFRVRGALTTNNIWMVTRDSQVTTSVGASDLMPLLCDPISVPFFPVTPPFNQLSLEEFALELGTGQSIHAAMTYRLQSGSDWEVIADKLTIRDIGVFISARRMSTPAMQAESPPQPMTGFSGRVSGTTSLCGYDLEVAIDMNGGPLWAVEIGSEKNPVLPSLTELAALVGISDPSEELTGGLQAFGMRDFTLTNIRIGFDRITKKLSYVFIGGSALIGGVKVNLFMRVPDLFISGTLASGYQIPLVSMLPDDVQLPGAFPDITFTDLEISLAPRRSAFTFGGTVNTNWEIIPGVFSLDKVRSHIGLARSGGKTNLTGGVGGSGTIAEASVQLFAEIQDVFTLSGGVTDLKLSALMERFLPGVDLPPEIPDLTFEAFRFSVTPSTGAFTIDGVCSVVWDLPFGVEGFAVSETSFNLSRPASTGATPGGITCSIGITGTGPVEIVDGVSFNSFSLAFNLTNQTSWSLAGSVSANIFDVVYTLAASLEQTPALRSIGLSIAIASGAPLLSLSGIGSLDVDSFAFKISKALQSAQASGGVSMSASSSYTWSVAAAGAIKIDGAFTLAGSLEILKSDTASGFAFRAAKATVEIPIPVPEYSIKTYLGLEYISVVRTIIAGQSCWAFDATIDVWFTGLPDTFQRILASKIVGRFKVDSTGAFVSIVRLTNLVEFTVPDMQFGSASVPIGLMAFDASNLMLRLGSNLSLTMDFGFGLPQSLNTMFGTKEDGTPAARFFNTYQAGNPASVTRFRLGVDSTAGVTFLLITSPIGGGSMAQQGQDTWFDIDFGEFGAIRLKVPVFVFNGFSYTAQGGFRQLPDKPLKVPLTPFKLLLEACRLNAVAGALPSGIPLTELSLVDDTNRFKFDEFIETIEKLGGFTIPQDIRDTLRFIEERLDALPNRFKSYLKIEIPGGFQFSFTITTDGQARGRVWVEGDKPVKFIYPTIGPLGPQMRGTELYSLMFGQMLSGQLLILDIDARVDTFDLVTLALATMLPLNKLPIAPDTHKLENRLIIKNLFMAVIYQTVIPIPVPLFYDELGVEYLGLEGFEFQTHWGFPKPKLDAGEAAKLFSDFKRFFTEHDYLLDPPGMPRNLTLQLDIGSNYVGLPKYLSGKTLGTRKPLASINALENLAHLLNALKTLSLNEVVQALPIEKRAGNDEITFGPLRLAVAWLMTTPDEFRGIGFKQLNARPEDVNGFMAVLPAVSSAGGGSRNEQGVVIFLRGSAEIKNAAKLETVFGIAVSDSTGFNTGFKISGVIAGFLNMELGGAVVINPKGSAVVTQPDPKKAPQGASAAVFYLNGHSYLSFLNYRVFTGDIQVIDDRFWLKGKLRLFPPSSPLDVSGDIEGWFNKTEFYLAGDVKTALAGLPLKGARGAVSNTRVFVSGSWLGQTVSLDVQAKGKDLIVRGTVVVGFQLQVDAGAVSKKVDIGTLGSLKMTQSIKLADGYRLDLNVTATLDVMVSNAGFAAAVVARFKVNNKDMSESFNLSVAPADVAALGEEINKRILAEPLKYFQTAFDTAAAWVQGITRGSIKWAKNANEDTGKALQYVYTQSSKQAAALLKSAGRTASEVSRVLKDGYKVASKDAAKILHDAGYGAQESADALYGVYKASVEDVSKAMKSQWNKSDKEMKSILKQAGYPGKEVDKAVDKLSDKDTWNPSKW